MMAKKKAKLTPEPGGIYEELQLETPGEMGEANYYKCETCGHVFASTQKNPRCPLDGGRSFPDGKERHV